MLNVTRSHAVTPVSLDLMDLSDLEIRREWSDIDVLLISRINQLIVVIENKINASESEGQLKKYKERVYNDFRPDDGWKHILIFLTIEGDQASDDAFVTVTHAVVVSLLDTLQKNRSDSIPPDVSLTIRHYIQMMRRHHMEDSELIGLAQRIYAKHRPALDFIFEHRPDAWSETRERLLARLNEDERFTVDVSTEKRVIIRIRPRSWAAWEPFLSTGTGWAAQGSSQILLCEIKPDTKREKARLQLVLGPGPKDVRDAIFNAVQAHGIYKQGYYPVWTSLLIKTWRSLQNESGTIPEQSAQNLFGDVEAFLLSDCPKIEQALSEAFANRSDRETS